LRANDGVVTDVLVDTPAGKAGIGPGMQILAVNGVRYSADAMHNAIKASKNASGPLMLEVQNDDVVKTLTIDYRGGTREPHLERDSSKPDVLAQILAPRAK
jgi:predicted metalloprotease with PDZ domain